MRHGAGQAFVQQRAETRVKLERKIKALARDRDSFLAREVTARGGAEDSLDQQVYDAVRTQAAGAGLTYESARPRY